eukprot:365607-Chlamydomonas_euryale.AAC.1
MHPCSSSAGRAVHALKSVAQRLHAHACSVPNSVHHHGDGSWNSAHSWSGGSSSEIATHAGGANSGEIATHSSEVATHVGVANSSAISSKRGGAGVCCAGGLSQADHRALLLLHLQLPAHGSSTSSSAAHLQPRSWCTTSLPSAPHAKEQMQPTGGTLQRMQRSAAQSPQQRSGGSAHQHSMGSSAAASMLGRQQGLRVSFVRGYASQSGKDIDSGKPSEESTKQAAASGSPRDSGPVAIGAQWVAGRLEEMSENLNRMTGYAGKQTGGCKHAKPIRGTQTGGRRRLQTRLQARFDQHSSDASRCPSAFQQRIALPISIPATHHAARQHSRDAVRCTYAFPRRVTLAVKS